MSFNYEREEAIRRAKGRLDGGYNTEYVYDKLLSDGFSEKEASDVIKSVTGKPFKASPKQVTAPAEAPPVVPAPQVKAPVQAIPIAPAEGSPLESFAEAARLSNPAQEPSPANPAEVSPLESFAEAARLSASAEEAATVTNPVEVAPLESFAEAAQLSASADEPASLASLLNPAQSEGAENSVLEQASEPASTPQTQNSDSNLRRQKDMAVMALQLLDGGYDSQYIYKKFIKEGYSHEEITAVLSRINSAGKQKAWVPTSSTGNQSAYTQPRAGTATKTSEFHRSEASQKAIALLESGYNGNFVYQRLINEGYSEEIAQTVVLRITGKQIGKPVAKGKNEPFSYRRTPYTPSQQQQQYSNSGGDGSTHVMIGVAMIVIGLGISFCSYQAAASSPNGGTYVVTFGLVIGGIFRVIKGLSQ